MIVWMVWDDRDRCHYRLRWDEENWHTERYINADQKWAASSQVSNVDMRKFIKGSLDTLLTELRT